MELIFTILSAIFILFLPGFFLSLNFFKLKDIDIIERIALSFVLSVVVVPLFVFYWNLLGIPITKITVILQTLLIMMLSSMVMVVKKWRELR